MVKKRPDFREYLTALAVSWGRLMSGPFALYGQIAAGVLLFAILAAAGIISVVAQDAITRLMAGALGVVALFVAFYNAWAKERNDSCDLSERLEPKLQLGFDRNDDGSFHLAPMFVNSERVGDFWMVRALPNCNAPSVRDVSGSINVIYKLVDGRWEKTRYNEALPLSWSILDTSNPINIIKDKRQFLNVLFISAAKVSVYPSGANRPARAEDELNFTDTFKVDVLISSAQGDSARIAIRLKVGADWRNPEVLESMDI